MVPYRIIINRSVEGSFEKIELDCATGKGAPRPFKFMIQRNAVEIYYEMSKVKPLDYIIEKSNVFRESLTKAYLCHALLLSSSLRIERMIIFIANKEYTIDRSCYNRFPFVFSVLAEDDLHLNNNFRFIAEKVVVNSIGCNQRDLRYTSLASYLSAKSKTYQIERFKSLWISMNALYNYVAKKYEEDLIRRCRNITYQDLKNAKLLLSNDSNCISALMYHLKAGINKLSRNAAKTIFDNNKDKFKQLSILFQKMSDEEIAELYTLSLNDLNTNGIIHALPEKYTILDTVSSLFSIPSYVYILLQHTYSLRCSLFHGNQAVPIICSYNDRNIGELKVINYFLDSFLGNEIPLLYSTDYYSNMRNDIIALMDSGLLNTRQNLYSEYIRTHQ